MAADLEFLTDPTFRGTQLEWTVCNRGDAPVPQWSSVGEYSVWSSPPGNAAELPSDVSRATIEIGPNESYEASVDVSSWGFSLNQGRHIVHIRIAHPYQYMRELEFEVRGTLLVPIGVSAWP